MAVTLRANAGDAFFRAEDAADYSAAVASVRDIQRGELYTMEWAGDAHLDRVLAANRTNTTEVLHFLCKNVLDDAPLPEVVTGFGCSAFAATNSAGKPLVGRNFDYRYPMAHVLLFSPRDAAVGRNFASVGTVDGGFAGFDVGSLTNLTDQTKADYPWHAALFPYLCMDGMNEAGFTVSVLSLDGLPDATGNKTRVIEQFVPGHTNIVPTLAIRYLLDRAGSTAEGIAMLTNFNMFASSGPGMAIQANYHFLLSDASGDSRVVEWLPPKNEGESWIPFVTNATAVSNFYLADGYGHGSNRWEIMRHALACRKHAMSEDDAMTLCRAASQKKGAEQTSWTHWSVVYNLADRTANIATLGNYDEIFPYSITSDKMTVGAAKSARPNVETNLQKYNPTTAVSGKVYYQEDSELSNPGHVPTVTSITGISSVNRSGCAYDSAEPIISRIVKHVTGSSLFYVAIPVDGDKTKKNWTYYALAGLNASGVTARVVHFRNPTGTGSLPASQAMCRALSNCKSDKASDYVGYLRDQLPYANGTGIVFTDAKGNVAIWPESSELEDDDTSELMCNSLDLRKGIYEIDGEERGQFDELPGLMRLASSPNTKAIVSMGYGRMNVMLPGTNLIWRAELEGGSAPAYGVIADPTPVPHAKVKVSCYYDEISYDEVSVETNSSGRMIAETNTQVKVVYTADAGYYFQNGDGLWVENFLVGPTVTIPPKPEIEPCQLVPIEYIDERGRPTVKKALILSSSSEVLTPIQTSDITPFAVTNDVTLHSGMKIYDGFNLILTDGAHLTVKSADEAAISDNSGIMNIFGQRLGTGRLSVYGDNIGLTSRQYIDVHGGTVSIAAGAGQPAVAGTGIRNNNSAMTVRNGDDYLPQTFLGKDGTYTASSLSGKRYLTIAPEIPTDVPTIGNATRKIYVYDYDAVEDMVWSNHTATVVWTAKDGYFFDDGSTAVTNTLDTTKSPATIVGASPASPQLPDVKVAFNANGGSFAGGAETETNNLVIADGYQFPGSPTRAGYSFAGWFESWTNGATQVNAGDEIANRQPHALYAHWQSTAPTPTAGTLALSDFNADGTPRKEVAAGSYANNATLTSLTTPLYLTSIGRGAFYNCKNLKALNLTQPRDYDDPDKPLTLVIGQQAFAGAPIEEVMLPSRIEICKAAFLNCTKLKRVFFLGNDEISYDATAFQRCGDGTLKLYMSAAFIHRNPRIVEDVKAQNPSITVKEMIGVAPVDSVGPVDIDVSALASGGPITLIVPVTTAIYGASPEETPVVKFATRLTGQPSDWQEVPSKVIASGEGVVILEVTPPDASGGCFFKIVVELSE